MDEKEKTIMFELDDETAPIVRTLLDPSSDLCGELIDFLTPGNVTKMPTDLFVYILIHVVNKYSNDKVEVKYCADDPNAEKPKYSVILRFQK